MNKLVKIIVIEGVILVVLLVLLLFPRLALKTTKVCFQSKCFQAEVADNTSTRERGLMNRRHLDDNKGMLFVFEKEGDYPFWMKNTLIALDMIWINQSNQVVFIKKNALSCGQGECNNIVPNQNGTYVLEINGGLAQKNNIKVGDSVVIDSSPYRQ